MVTAQQRKDYAKKYGYDSPYWQQKAKQYQIRQAVKKRGRKAVEAELKVQQQQEQEQVYAEWKEEVYEQYPSSQYSIRFVDQGAMIYQRQHASRASPRMLVAGHAPTSTGQTPTFVPTPSKRVEGGLSGGWQPTGTRGAREIYVEPKSKPASTPSALQLKRQEYDMKPLLAPTLISLREAGVKRLSEELYARGDPYGHFTAGVVAAGETTMELVFPHPTGKSPEFHDVFALPGQPPAFIAGRVMGEVAIAFSLGKIFEGPLTVAGETVKAVGAKVVPKAVKTAVHSAVQTVRFSPVAKAVVKVSSKLPKWKGSRVDVFLGQRSSWYLKKTGGIRGVQEVVIPPVSRVSLPTLQAHQVAAFMLDAPRTSGVWYNKLWLEPLAKKPTKHLISHAGKLSIGYLRETGFQKTPIETLAEQRALTPVVTQTQVTRMGIIPYVGGKTSVPSARATASLLGSMALSVAPKLVPKLRLEPKLQPLEWQPTLTRERQRLQLATLQEQEQKQRQLLAPPRLMLKQLQHAPTRQIQEPRLDQRQAVRSPLLLTSTLLSKQEQKILPSVKPIQRQRYAPPVPTLPRLTPPTLPLHLRNPLGGSDVSRGKRGLLGKWFKREHRIKSAEDMWRSFAGKPRRKTYAKGGVPSWF